MLTQKSPPGQVWPSDVVASAAWSTVVTVFGQFVVAAVQALASGQYVLDPKDLGYDAGVFLIILGGVLVKRYHSGPQN